MKLNNLLNGRFYLTTACGKGFHTGKNVKFLDDILDSTKNLIFYRAAILDSFTY